MGASSENKPSYDPTGIDHGTLSTQHAQKMQFPISTQDLSVRTTITLVVQGIVRNRVSSLVQDLALPLLPPKPPTRYPTNNPPSLLQPPHPPPRERLRRRRWRRTLLCSLAKSESLVGRIRYPRNLRPSKRQSLRSEIQTPAKGQKRPVPKQSNIQIKLHTSKSSCKSLKNL